MNGYEVYCDGIEIDSRDDVTSGELGGLYSEKRGRAYDHLIRFLQKQELDGVSVDVQPAHEHGWGSPYEDFGKSGGSVKHIVTDTRIQAEHWVRLQGRAHGVPAHADNITEQATENATQDTADWVEKCVNNETPGNIDMPVLEIWDGSCDHAEGRSRGVGVMQSDSEYIPVRVASKVYK